jgi:predicted NAD-dependent protein-ADP-ribosyltransferase YbiA (DUF1768 family)
MSDKASIITFVKNFKDEVLIPFAQAGFLTEETLYEAENMYVRALAEQKALSTAIMIDKDGFWKELHPLSPMKFELGGVVYGSLTHYRYACRYDGADKEAFEYIMNSSTPEVAVRRGEMALQNATPVREDWEYSQEANLKVAMRAILNAHPEVKKRLNDTSASTPIHFKDTNDEYLGEGLSKKGQNILPKILKELRNE